MPPTNAFFPSTTLFRSQRATGMTIHAPEDALAVGHKLLQTLKMECVLVTLDRDGMALVHGDGRRSEEHTSELQSHVNVVCRLLLQKKKTISKPRSTSSR